MNSHSLFLRLIFTFLAFIILSTVIFLLKIGNIISIISFSIFIWILCWTLSKQLVEYQFLNRNIVPFTNKAVMITGCDSGFGKRTSIKLSKIGYHVFACCYNKESEGYKELVELSRTSIGKLDVIVLDVTSDQSVNTAYEFVKRNLHDDEKLWAVVNNAGIGCYHGWNWQSNPIEYYENIFSVNTIGVVRVTHKFSSLLLETPNSRIIFLSSYAGRISLSGMVAYCMSKHSIRVFGNCLRRELDHLKIRSIIIEPTMYKTEMTNEDLILKSFEHSWSSIDSELREKIGLNFYEQMHKGMMALLNTTRDQMDDVVDTIVKAVQLSDPYPFYKVSNFLQLLVLYLVEYLPEETHDIVFSGKINNFFMKILKFKSR